MEVWCLKNLGRKNITIIVAPAGRHGRAGGGGGCGGGGGLGGRDHLPVVGNVDVGRGGRAIRAQEEVEGRGGGKDISTAVMVVARGGGRTKHQDAETRRGRNPEREKFLVGFLTLCAAVNSSFPSYSSTS